MSDSLVDKRLRYIQRQRALAAGSDRFAGVEPQGSGPLNRHGMPKLPIGQREVQNWPVLDLGDVPNVPTSAWRLDVGGQCEHPFTLTWEEFMALPQVEDDSDGWKIGFNVVHKNELYGVLFAILFTQTPDRQAKFAEICTSAGIPLALLVLPFVFALIPLLFFPIQLAEREADETSAALKALVSLSAFFQKVSIFLFAHVILRILWVLSAATA